jgi:hypothetical protein
MVKFANIVFLIFVSFAYTSRLKIERKPINTTSSLISFQKKLKDCNANTCNGECVANICNCREGYIDISILKQNSKACSYKQRKLILAFYLEFILPGVGHIYANRIIFGIMKMFIIILLIFLLRNIADKSSYANIFRIIFTIVFGMLHVIDILAFLLNRYTDGYGMPLIPINIDS